MERELRDVVSKLTSCVAMRYATESNLQYIAETEKKQRTAWEVEFSSCAHPAVILPPGGVTRRRRSKASGSNKNNDRNQTQSTTDLGSSFNSAGANTESQQIRQQHQHHQQQNQHHQHQRFLYQDEGPEEPHKQNSMGSAEFLFTCNPALEHRFKTSNSEGFGGRHARSDSTDDGGTNDRNITRWGSERAILKGPLSPYKLEVDGMTQQELHHELDHGHDFCEMAASSSTPSTTTGDRPRRCTHVMGAATNQRHVTPPPTGGALVSRDGVLRRSTWLGPEVSPLRNEQEAARLNSPSPFAVKFSAAAWPSPKQNGRWRRSNRDIKICRSVQGGSNSGDSERGVRPHCRRGIFQQYSIYRTENSPPRGVSDAQQTAGFQASPRVELGARPSYCDTSRNSRSSVCSNTVAAGCSSKERLGAVGFVPVRTEEIPGSPSRRQNEACPLPSCSCCSSSPGGQVADEQEGIPTATRPLSKGTRTHCTKTDEPPPRLANPHQGEQDGGADQVSKEAGAVVGRAGGAGKLVTEWSTNDYDLSEDAIERTTPTEDAANAAHEPAVDDENAGRSAAACSFIPRPTSADAALLSSKTGRSSKGVAASPSSKVSISSYPFATPELMSTILAVRGTVGARRQPQQRSHQVPAESRPHHQQTEPLGLARQPSLQQRRNASEDQDDQSECTVSQEKHVMLLTRRLKQLVQLETITIQWERLSRREREKLDRQQHLIGSRFRITKQLRRQRSFDTCAAVPPVEGAGFWTAAVQSGGGGGRGGGRFLNSSGVNNNSSPHSATSQQSIIMPPSDASISLSIDRPHAGDGVSGVASGVAATDARVKEGARVVEAGSVGKGAPDHLSRSGKATFGGATPRGERRRRGEGGRAKRGGTTCGVQDADIVSGLARRGRLGDPFFGIVGIRSSITTEDQ